MRQQGHLAADCVTETAARLDEKHDGHARSPHGWNSIMRACSPPHASQVKAGERTLAGSRATSVFLLSGEKGIGRGTRVGAGEAEGVSSGVLIVVLLSRRFASASLGGWRES